MLTSHFCWFSGYKSRTFHRSIFQRVDVRKNRDGHYLPLYLSMVCVHRMTSVFWILQDTAFPRHPKLGMLWMHFSEMGKNKSEMEENRACSAEDV